MNKSATDKMLISPSQNSGQLIGLFNQDKFLKHNSADDNIILIKLEDPEDKYEILLNDIKGLTDLFNDLHTIVNQQQDSINLSESIIQHTYLPIKSTEEDLKQGAEYQAKSNYLSTILYLAVGTALGVSFGSIGAFTGIKSITFLITGGIGLTYQFYTAYNTAYNKDTSPQ